MASLNAQVITSSFSPITVSGLGNDLFFGYSPTAQTITAAFTYTGSFQFLLQGAAAYPPVRGRTNYQTSAATTYSGTNPDGIASSLLSGGATVNSGLTYTSQLAPLPSSLTDAYIGLDVQVGGNTYYGYAEISTGPALNVPDGPSSVILDSIAFQESPNTPIETPLSGVPEPSAYALILGGCALGFAAWRRRKVSPLAA